MESQASFWSSELFDELLTVSSICLFSLFPFVLFAQAVYLSRRSCRFTFATLGFVVFGVGSASIAFPIITEHRISKFPDTDGVFLGIFVLTLAAGGALAGALFDRLVSHKPLKPS